MQYLLETVQRELMNKLVAIHEFKIESDGAANHDVYK